MPELINAPTVLEAPGNKPKFIHEYVGCLNTGDPRLSIAKMQAPAGWVEPGQRPDFDEWTLVLNGQVVVEHEGGSLTVEAGQAVVARAGEWVRYSTPVEAEYVAVCLPAFTIESVNRDPS